MVKVIAGERIGKEGRLGIDCSAFVFEASWEKVFLIQRSDDGKWAITGGATMAEESLSEACETESLEMHGMDRMRLGDGFTGKMETIIYDDYDV
jgi:ADP-ribose pyrophosphatase YjhB (NUDIX family)